MEGCLSFKFNITVGKYRFNISLKTEWQMRAHDRTSKLVMMWVIKRNLIKQIKYNKTTNL